MTESSPLFHSVAIAGSGWKSFHLMTFFVQNAYRTVLIFYFFLQEVWERTGSELDSMVGDTNLFLSEGGKHAEVSINVLLTYFR